MSGCAAPRCRPLRGRHAVPSHHSGFGMVCELADAEVGSLGSSNGCNHRSESDSETVYEIQNTHSSYPSAISSRANFSITYRFV